MTTQLFVLPVGLNSERQSAIKSTLLPKGLRCFILTTATTKLYPIHVAPHGRPGLGGLEHIEPTTPPILTWRIFAPVPPVFDARARQGRRKSRRSQCAVPPTLTSPVTNCLAAIHPGSILHTGAVLPMITYISSDSSPTPSISCNSAPKYANSVRGDL